MNSTPSELLDPVKGDRGFVSSTRGREVSGLRGGIGVDKYFWRSNRREVISENSNLKLQT